MNVYKNLILFLRNPVLEKDRESDFVEKFTQFILLFIACFTISVFLSIIISIIYESGLIENDYHAFDNLKDLESYKILLIAAVGAPVIEEIIFRGPLVLFKNPKVFKIAFYVLAVLFGYVHISNYQIDTQILLFSPILVAPQMILGLIFGYIRVRFGLLWAIAMHALYNGFLVSLFLISKDAIQ